MSTGASSSASDLGSDILPPLSTQDTPPFHSSHGISSFKPVTVTDHAGDASTSHRDMNQQARGKKHKDHRRCGNVFATLKDVCMRHKQTRPLGKAPGVGQSITAMLKTSRLNVLLVLIPVSWISHFLTLNDTLVFVFSFLAFVPLAIVHDFVLDELTLRLGQMPAGLLNATMGNAVALILAITALIKCELAVVQSSQLDENITAAVVTLVGFILNNLLLVLGTCFFAGGTRFSEQGFGIGVVQLNSSLLTLSVIAVLLPAAFHNTTHPTNGNDPVTGAQEDHDILSISHGVAIILLLIYLCFLVFQLFSHKNLYDERHLDVQQSVHYTPRLAKMLHINQSQNPPPSPHPQSSDSMDPVSTQRDVCLVEKGTVEDDDVETPQMGIRTAIVLFAVLTVVIAITSESLVGSISGLTQSGHISKRFVAIVLLPIVGNVDQHVTAITVSVKDKLMLSLSVAVGSSIQIALFVIPFLVTLGWILGKPLTLLFDPFESIVLFLSVVTVNYIVQNGKSNWLEGMILMCLYVIFAITFWYYPVSDLTGIFITCH